MTAVTNTGGCVVGMFRDSPEEKTLRDEANQIASLCGMVASGEISVSDLEDVVSHRLDTLRNAYDAVATKHGPKASTTILKHSHDIARIRGDRNTAPAVSMLNDVLARLNRPL